MAFVPEAHAVTSVSTGPSNPHKIDICPDAILAIIIGTAKGFTFPGPLFSIRSTVSSIVPIPPIPVPITVPARAASSFVMSNLASAIAILAAATANWAFLSICLTVFLSPTNVSASKFFTSPAIFTGNSEASNSVIKPTPDTPFNKFSQNVDTPIPTGDTTPNPVTTTRLVIFLSLSILYFIITIFINYLIHPYRIKPQKNGSQNKTASAFLRFYFHIGRSGVIP